MNLPNKLTLARVIAVPFFIIAYLTQHFYIAVILFILASVTDMLDGKIVNYTQNDGMLSNYIRTLYEMKDGTIAVSVTGGVQLIRDGGIVKSFGESNGIPTNSILSLCEDFEGRLILGTNGKIGRAHV